MSREIPEERQRGNRLGFWFFQSAIRIFGLRGAYGLLYFVGLYYLAFDWSAVRASLAYVRRRFPAHSTVRRLFDVYLLFVSQGKNLIDRSYLMAGGSGIDVELKGLERIRELLAPGRKGLILLTAHVGNWQVAMTALRKFGKTVHLMMRPEDNAAVKQALNVDGGQDRVRVLFTSNALGGVVEALKALDNGDLVSIMGDRTYEYDSLEARLLGGIVRFPYGAFSIAAAAQSPVVVLLSAKTGAKKYVVDASHVIAAPAGARGRKWEEINSSVQEFADVLEEYAADHPYQWFVFRDLWQPSHTIEPEEKGHLTQSRKERKENQKEYTTEKT